MSAKNPRREVLSATAIADLAASDTAPRCWRFVLKLSCGHVAVRPVRWTVREGEAPVSVRCAECGQEGASMSLDLGGA